MQKDATGVPVKAVGVIIDIDREKRSTEKLLEQARRDTLTKLYNKGTSEKLIRELLPANGEVSALLIIDMDDFKLVNDSKGHMFGDAFLVETANEIRKRFRQMDVVGRIGGDEFLVFIRAIPSLDLVREKAEQIIAAVRELGAAAIWRERYPAASALPSPRIMDRPSRSCTVGRTTLCIMRKSRKKSLCHLRREADGRCDGRASAGFPIGGGSGHRLRRQGGDERSSL